MGLGCVARKNCCSEEFGVGGVKIFSVARIC